MVKVKLFLKSGQTLEFKCETADFTYSKATGEFVGYKFSGIAGYEQVSVVPTQIAAYTTTI